MPLQDRPSAAEPQESLYKLLAAAESVAPQVVLPRRVYRLGLSGAAVTTRPRLSPPLVHDEVPEGGKGVRCGGSCFYLYFLVFSMFFYVFSMFFYGFLWFFLFFSMLFLVFSVFF